MIFNQGKGTIDPDESWKRIRGAWCYFANLSSSAWAICTGSWWSLDVDILRWSGAKLLERPTMPVEHLLPLGPSLCGCESCFIVNRVELGVISKDHIFTLGFWDGSSEFIPENRNKLKLIFCWGIKRSWPCFWKDVTSTILVEEAEFTITTSVLSRQIYRQ